MCASENFELEIKEEGILCQKHTLTRLLKAEGKMMEGLGEFIQQRKEQHQILHFKCVY